MKDKPIVQASTGARVIFINKLVINNEGFKYTPSWRQRFERLLGICDYKKDVNDFLLQSGLTELQKEQGDE